jgi:hypothetical protein
MLPAHQPARRICRRSPPAYQRALGMAAGNEALPATLLPGRVAWSKLMRRSMIVFALLAGAVVAAPAARATGNLPDRIVQSLPDSSLAYSRYKRVKVKAVKRRGPPPWAPAHGLRRKLRR